MKIPWMTPLAVALLSTASHAAQAQWLVSNDPGAGILSVSHANGNSLTYDARAQLAILENADGARLVATFAEVAAAKSPHANEQAEFIQNLVNEILHATNRVAFTSETRPTLSLPGQSGGGAGPGPGGVIGIQAAGVASKGSERMTDFMEGDGGGSCRAPPHPCNCLTSDCSPFRTDWGHYFYGWDQHAPSTGMTDWAQACRTLHRNQWDLQHAGQCENAVQGAALSAVGVVLTTGSCGLAFATATGGGWTGLVCLGTAATTGITAMIAWRSYQMCTAGYPGPPASCGTL